MAILFFAHLKVNEVATLDFFLNKLTQQKGSLMVIIVMIFNGRIVVTVNR